MDKSRKYILIIMSIMILLALPTNVVNSNPMFKLEVTTISDSDGRKQLELDWGDSTVSNGSPFGEGSDAKYVVARREVTQNSNGTTTTGKWEYRGRYNDTVKVLNLYPSTDPNSPSNVLEKWLNEPDKDGVTINNQAANGVNVDIDITPVSLESFNANPNAYLKKDANNYYNYDVVVFGFVDSNNGMDISTIGANLIQDFINHSGGVLLGHDTVNYANNALSHNNFIKLATDNMDIVVAERDVTIWTYSNHVRATHKSAFTTFPFDISSKTLNIPLSHTVAALPKYEENVYMTFQKDFNDSEGNGPYFQYNMPYGANSAIPSNKDSVTTTYNDGSGNKDYRIDSYLTMSNNVGIIQTGHITGEATLDERSILANTLYYLAKVYNNTNAIDLIVDEKNPEAPNYSINDNKIVFDSTDTGNTYEYRVIAVPLSGVIPSLDDSRLLNALETGSSYGSVHVTNSELVSVGGELKEFQYVINNNPSEDVVDYGRTLNMHSSTESDPYEFFEKNKRMALTNNEYMHVIAIDKASNESTVTTINLWNELPDIEVTYKFWSVLDDHVLLSDETVVKKYGEVIYPGGIHATTVDRYWDASYQDEHGQVVGRWIDLKYSYDEIHNTATGVNTLMDNELLLVDDAVIIHRYEEIIDRPLLLVEYKNLSNPPEVSVQDYSTPAHIIGSTQTLTTPPFKHYNARNYYTEYTVEGGEHGQGVEIPFDGVDEDGNYITDVTWDTYPLYAHYDKKIVDVTLNFYRDGVSDREYLGNSYVTAGYSGEVLNIDGSDVVTETDIENLLAYSNSEEVSNSRQIRVNMDDSQPVVENIEMDIKLEPRSRTVSHIGVVYDDNENYIETIQLDKCDVLYSNQTLMTIDATYEGEEYIDGVNWKLIDSLQGNLPVINFEEDDKSTVYVVYFTGNLPGTLYDLEINRYNDYENDLLSSETVQNIYPNTVPGVTVQEEKTVLNYAPSNGLDVDFKLARVVVTTDSDEKEYVWDADGLYLTELETLFINKDSSADWKVDFYYTPLTTINYEVTINHKGPQGNISISDTLSKFSHNALTLINKYINVMDFIGSDYPTSEFDLLNFEIDGSHALDSDGNPEPLEISDYEHNVKVDYIEKMYHLFINYHYDGELLSSETVHLANPIYDPIVYTLLMENELYDYIGFDVSADGVIDEEQTYTTIENNRLVFDPKEDGTYEVNVYYRKKGVVDISYRMYNLDGPEVEGRTARQLEVYMGDFVTAEQDDYVDLSHAYVDNVLYEDVEEGDGFLVNDIKHEVVLIYEDPKLYTLTVEVDENHGIAFSSDDRLFAKEETPYLYAQPHEGYMFDKWEFVEQNGAVIDDIYSQNPMITMPEDDVVVRAVFESFDSSVVDPNPDPDKNIDLDVDLEISDDYTGEGQLSKTGNQAYILYIVVIFIVGIGIRVNSIKNRKREQ